MERILLTLSLLILVSCAKDLGKNDEDFKILRNLDQKVGFSLIKSEIMLPKCSKCHAWSLEESEVLKRIVHGSPEESSLFLQVDTGEMPLGGVELNPSEKRLIYDYILNLEDVSDQTQVGNTPDPKPGNSEPTPIPTEPTPTPVPQDPLPRDPVELFTKVKKEILIPKCSRCHGWASNDEGIKNRIVDGQPESSRLFLRVEDGSMPFGGPALSEEEVEQIREYILAL